jgi:hypothetical protein
MRDHRRMRRAPILVALALVALVACERPPGAAPREPSNEPLVVGRSPPALVASANAVDDYDAGTSPTRDAAVVYTGCHIDARGTNGGITADLACVVEQEEARGRGDAAATQALRIWDSPPRLPGDPAIRVVLLRMTAPVAGVQTAASFVTYVEITHGSQRWEARGGGSFGVTTGTTNLTLTRVRTVRAAAVGDLGSYELHGRVDAQLVPDWQGTATGFVDVHADF